MVNWDARRSSRVGGGPGQKEPRAMTPPAEPLPPGESGDPERGVRGDRAFEEAAPRNSPAQVMDAFLVFSSEEDRRRLHRLNETFVGEWQLRLLPCSSWAIDDASAQGGYEDPRKVMSSAECPPRGGGGASERDRDGKVCAESTGDEDELRTVVSRVEAARERLGLTGDIVVFGSHINGFSTPGSDCDLSYMPPEGSIAEKPIRVLEKFANELPAHGFDGIIRVFQANLPLLKAVHKSGTKMDLCVGHKLGHQNSKLIAAYYALDTRVGKVGKLVKQWAKAWELNGSSDGHLNSYAYTLLTIYYMMHTKPPIVPNLQDLASQDEDKVEIRDGRWGREQVCDCTFWGDVHLIPRTQNTDSVGTLLQGFFEFYTDPQQFDWGFHAVSIRRGMTEPSTSKFALPTAVREDQWYVEDPFDLKHNLASQCTAEGRQRILKKMGETLRELRNAPSADEMLPRFASYCSRAPTSYSLKCRVNTEKVTMEDFIRAFSSVHDIKCWTVRFPLPSRTREVRSGLRSAHAVDEGSALMERAEALSVLREEPPAEVQFQ